MKHMKEKTLRSLMRQGKASVEADHTSQDVGFERKGTCIVRLNFVPLDRYADLGHENADRNGCVGCGADDVARFYVVPRQFFQHLPISWKASNCHDVVLLCPRCRSHIEQPQAERSASFLAEFGGRTPPSGLQGCANETPLPPLERRVMACSRALLKHRQASAGRGPGRHVLPPAKVGEFEDVIRGFLLPKDGSPDLGAAAERGSLADAELTRCAAAPSSAPPAQRAVEAVLALGEEALLAWIRDWRRFFLERVKPQCLPESWSADFNAALASTSRPSAEAGVEPAEGRTVEPDVESEG